jgi:hypothetical protein
MPITILIILLFMKLLNEQKKKTTKLLIIYEHVKPLFKGIHFFDENNKIITTL